MSNPTVRDTKKEAACPLCGGTGLVSTRPTNARPGEWVRVACPLCNTQLLSWDCGHKIAVPIDHDIWHPHWCPDCDGRIEPECDLRSTNV